MQRHPSRAPRAVNARIPTQKLGLPDKIPAKPHTIFVGINPGARSAKIGHYYGGHTNYFWKLFHEAGFWPKPLTTFDDDKILAKGYGLTDVAKRPTPGVGDLKSDDFHESQTRIQQIAEHYRPKTIVFVGKLAARAYLENFQAPIEYGRQDWQIGTCTVFVLPSTSGASLGHTSYADKLVEFKALKKHVATYHGAATKNASWIQRVFAFARS